MILFVRFSETMIELLYSISDKSANVSIPSPPSFVRGDSSIFSIVEQVIPPVTVGMNSADTQ